MGWLDNSTNNIILDAVLTDYGRESLAKNNGSFNIMKFSLGDDEVNYNIIQKYGRTIGREKIEKNTPVFEAITNQSLALKHKLVSIPAPLTYMPKIVLASTSNSTPVVYSSGPTNFTIQQQLSDSDSASDLDPNIADANFTIYYPTIFLRMNDPNSVPGQTYQDSLRTGVIVLSTNSRVGQRYIDISLYSTSISETSFRAYGELVDGYYQISTSIKIVGQSSGLMLNLPITVTNKSSR